MVFINELVYSYEFLLHNYDRLGIYLEIELYLDWGYPHMFPQWASHR